MHTAVARLGFWSASVACVAAVWFAVAFGLYQPILHAPWHGIAAYAASFRPAPFLAWVVPCFVLAPTYLTTISCLHFMTTDKRRLWSLLSLVFAGGYASVLAPLYYVQMAVVLPGLARGTTAGLELWLFAPPYPNSIPGAFEAVGYGSMSLSFVAAASAFRDGRLEAWARRAFVATGVTGLLVFIDPLIRLPLLVVLADAAINAFALSAALALLAIVFWRSDRDQARATVTRAFGAD